MLNLQAFQFKHRIDRHEDMIVLSSNRAGWRFRHVTERTLIELALKREGEKNLALLHNTSDG
jgi:hypothetical protein